MADLEPGDCISAEGLQGDAESFGTITQKDCSEAHHAEVLAVGTLSERDVDSLETLGFTTRCDILVPPDVRRYLRAHTRSVDQLTIHQRAEVGEAFACLAVAPGMTSFYTPLMP